MEGKETCFVIQPFCSPFNERYEGAFKPAIEAVGLNPYRVDNDPSVSVPIESIHREIDSAAICLVDITLDNPNVWYELGYALAKNKPVVLLSARDREGKKYPFDVQHLFIQSYDLVAKSDWDKLAEKITERLKAKLEKRDAVQLIAESPIKPVKGLTTNESSALLVVIENLNYQTHDAPVGYIYDDMTQLGFNRAGTYVAIEGLTDKGYLKRNEIVSDHGTIFTYALSAEGRKWVLDNQSTLNLRSTPSRPAPSTRSAPSVAPYPDDDYDDSDPFADE